MEMAVMSLSAHERRVLDSIQDRLSGSDPELASLLASFTRLTAGGQMPARESIRAGWQRLSWPGIRLLAGLLIVMGLIALAAAFGGGACSAQWAVTCAGHATVRTAPQPPGRQAMWRPGLISSCCAA
jgi:hypothetical protein